MTPLTRRKLLLTSLSGLAVALAGAAWLGLREPYEQRQELPDGTVLELLGVTYGNHELAYASRWERAVLALESRFPKSAVLLGKLIPGSISPPAATLPSGTSALPAFLGLNAGIANSDALPHTPLVWFRVRESPRPLYSNEEELIASARDEDGCLFRYFPGGSGQLAGFQPVPGHANERLAVAELPYYPRRPTRFYYDVASRSSNGRPLARFTIWSPTPASTTEWSVPAGAATVDQDGMRCSLDRLSAGCTYRDGWEASARFHLVETDRPSRRWGVRWVTATDATGDRRETDLTGLSDQATFFCPCPREKAWKIGLELAPTPDALPEAELRLPRLAVPGPHGGGLANRVIETPGATITVSKIRRVEAVPRRPRVPEIILKVQSTSRCLVRTYAHPVGPSRPHERAAETDYLEPGQSVREILFPQLAGRNSLDLRITISRLRHVQLLVRPNAEILEIPQ